MGPDDAAPATPPRPHRTSLDRPPTLDEWRAWAETATRNATDEPIGRDGARRHVDARSSEIVSAHPPIRSGTAASISTTAERPRP